jgi:hypothetical protein
MKVLQVARLLAYITGSVNQQLLLQNEYLSAQKRCLRVSRSRDCRQRTGHQDVGEQEVGQWPLSLPSIVEAPPRTIILL